MKRLFVSMPMNGIPDDVINTKFAEIEEMVERDYTVLPSKLPLVEGVSPVYYLGSSLHMMSLADAILLCDGWEKSRGCKIEFQVAKLYGIPILFEQDL